MPDITLPDGKKLSFKNKVTGLEVAEKISKSLSKQALIVSVNGELKDLSFSIQKDSSVKIITNKDKEGLDVIRHDAAHIMAMAVQELFPGTQVTIGPVIENGFYYDFVRKEPFTSDDLKKIEKKMSEIIDRDVKTKREVWKRSEAITHYSVIDSNNKYSILKLIPETGRKHQLRKQLLIHGCPILGDSKYNMASHPIKKNTLMLHAHKIEFCHPSSNKKMNFEAPLPNDFIKIMNVLDEYK